MPEPTAQGHDARLQRRGGEPGGDRIVLVGGDGHNPAPPVGWVLAPVQDARRLVGDLGMKPLIARPGTEHGSGLGTQHES